MTVFSSISCVWQGFIWNIGDLQKIVFQLNSNLCSPSGVSSTRNTSHPLQFSQNVKNAMHFSSFVLLKWDYSQTISIAAEHKIHKRDTYVMMCWFKEFFRTSKTILQFWKYLCSLKYELVSGKKQSICQLCTRDKFDAYTIQLREKWIWKICSSNTVGLTVSQYLL